MTRLSKIALLMFSVVLTGCNFIHDQYAEAVCDPCPNPAEKRDMFCGCYSDNEKDENVANANHSNWALVDVLCKTTSGVYIGYMRQKPIKPPKPGQVITLKPSGISGLICSGEGESQITNPIKIRISHTNEIDFAVYKFSIFGRYTENSGSIKDNYIFSTRVAKFNKSLDRGGMVMAMYNQSCESVCDDGDQECLSMDAYGAEDKYTDNFSVYVNRILKGENIMKSELMASFGVDADGCNRGDISVMNIEGRVLANNEGLDCDIDHTINDLIGIHMDVPASVNAAVANDGVLNFIGTLPQVELSLDGEVMTDYSGGVVGVKLTNGDFQASCPKIFIQPFFQHT